MIDNQRLNKSVAEELHEELYRKTTEYQYYLFGVAQGFYSLYETFTRLKDTGIDPKSEDVVQIIDEMMTSEGSEFKYYFDRLKGSK